MTLVANTGYWEAISATLKGSAKGASEVCQDEAAAFVVRDGRWAVLCVADGAGSRSMSHVGARMLVEGLQCELVALGSELGSVQRADDVRATVGKLARGSIKQARSRLTASEVSLDEYASTFGLALVSEGIAGFAALGDVFGCVRRSGSARLHLVLPNKRMLPPTGGTDFFTDSNWSDKLDVRIVVDGAVDAAVLSTDGLEDVAIGWEAVSGQDAGPPLWQPRDVYVLDELIAPGPGALTADGLVADLSVPEILNRKGDDIGIAVALRSDTVPR